MSVVDLGDALRRAMEKLREAEAESRTPARSTRTGVRSRQAQASELIDVPAAPRIQASAPAQPAVPAPAPRNVLARFADGSLRSAVILSEILGRPIADR